MMLKRGLRKRKLMENSRIEEYKVKLLDKGILKRVGGTRGVWEVLDGK